MGKPVRIMLVAPVFEDPTSFYRGAGPFSSLQQQLGNITFLFPQQINWAMLKLCDILILQRPHLQMYWQTMCMAKDLGIPVIVDFDDDNLAVPKSNPLYHTYNDAGVKDAIVRLSRGADAVWVATKKLHQRYSIYNKNVIHIPNAIDDVLLRHRNIPNAPRQKVLLWRGTSTHASNLKIVQKEVISLAKAHKDWMFGFWGYDPLEITEEIRNFQTIPMLPPIDYFKHIVNLHASALWYSLGDNDHSQSRSHVSWLEASFGAMQMIAPKHPEFERPGVLNFSTPEEFTAHCEAVIKGEVDIDKNVNESWQCILDNYLLSKVNLQRQQCIEQLLGRPIAA